MIRIGIFGRHSVERAEVRQSVEQDDQVRVVSEGSIASASRLARTATPDILVLSHSNVDEALYTLRELDRLATTPKSIVLVDHVTEPGARRLLDRGRTASFTAATVWTTSGGPYERPSPAASRLLQRWHDPWWTATSTPVGRQKK